MSVEDRNRTRVSVHFKVVALDHCSSELICPRAVTPCVFGNSDVSFSITPDILEPDCVFHKEITRALDGTQLVSDFRRVRKIGIAARRLVVPRFSFVPESVSPTGIVSPPRPGYPAHHFVTSRRTTTSYVKILFYLNAPFRINKENALTAKHYHHPPQALDTCYAGILELCIRDFEDHQLRQFLFCSDCVGKLVVGYLKKYLTAELFDQTGDSQLIPLAKARQNWNWIFIARPSEEWRECVSEVLEPFDPTLFNDPYTISKEEDLARLQSNLCYQRHTVFLPGNKRLTRGVNDLTTCNCCVPAAPSASSISVSFVRAPDRRIYFADFGSWDFNLQEPEARGDTYIFDVENLFQVFLRKFNGPFECAPFPNVPC